MTHFSQINLFTMEIINEQYGITMGRLSNQEFLDTVDKVLTSNGGKSSVYLTQKRLTSVDIDGGETSDLSTNVIDYSLPAKNSQKYPILLRLSMNGKKKGDKSDKLKLSTVIEVDNLPQFWVNYINVIKSGFVGLKKKEKKRKNRVSK